MSNKRPKHSAMLLRACLLLVVSTTAAFAFPQSTRSRLFIDHSIYSDESPPRFLGSISTSTGGDSILNTYGSYGSSYSSTSIRNNYSSYGSAYSSFSAYSSSASRPPMIVNNRNVIVGYVTKNTSKPSGIDPDFLLYGLTALNNWSFYSNLFDRDLFSNGGVFLGNTTPDSQSQFSIANKFGVYGSSSSSTSIFNSFSAYGSEFNSQSAYNSFATTPPRLFVPQQQGGQFLAFVTKNTFRTPAADPDALRAALLLAPDMPSLRASSYLLEGVTTTRGTPSSARVISISGGNLVTTVTVTLLPFEKYWEISADGSSFGSELQLQPSNGRLNRKVYIRLSASAPLTAKEPGGRVFSGFVVATAYAGVSIYMAGTVTAPTSPPPVVDRIRPTLNVTAPKGSLVTSTARRFTLRGTARDNVSPTQIQFKVSSPGGSYARNWTTVKLSGGNTKTKGWSRPISLTRKGDWAVQIRALDARSNASAVRTITIRRL